MYPFAQQLFNVSGALDYGINQVQVIWYGIDLLGKSGT